MSEIIARVIFPNIVVEEGYEDEYTGERSEFCVYYDNEADKHEAYSTFFETGDMYITGNSLDNIIHNIKKHLLEHSEVREIGDAVIEPEI